jgi:hypothetical protein
MEITKQESQVQADQAMPEEARKAELDRLETEKAKIEDLMSKVPQT